MKTLLGLASLALMLAPYSHAQNNDAGETLYKLYCTQCHGINGDGKGVNAAQMSVQPRSHIDREEMMARSNDELFKVIEQGGKSIDKSNLMPAWGDNFSDDEITALVAHLRSLCCEDN